MQGDQPPPAVNGWRPSAQRIEHAGSRTSVAVLLTVSGGFLDAFAYVGHGHVFANAMTGNVALLGIHAAAGEWRQALRHVPPVLAFMAALFVSHLLRLPAPARTLRDPALACLVLETLCLAAGAAVGRWLPDALLIPAISFLATLQTTSFTRLGAQSYTSVITTGNLRRFAQCLFAGLIPRRDPAQLQDAWRFGTVCVAFLAGAVLGGVCTAAAPVSALWVAVGLLLAALIEIVWLARCVDSATLEG